MQRDFVPEIQLHLLDMICAHYNKTVYPLCPYLDTLYRQITLLRKKPHKKWGKNKALWLDDTLHYLG